MSKGSSKILNIYKVQKKFIVDSHEEYWLNIATNSDINIVDFFEAPEKWVLHVYGG